MPKIQDMIGQRGIQVGGGIATGRTGQVESAITNLGNTVETIGQRIQEREDRLGYIKAKSEFLKKKTEADSAFMDDEDYKTFVPRYSEAMNKARDESLQAIRHPDLKAQFEADAGLDIQQGLSRTAQLAWMKEKEYGKAGVINVLSQNREAFLRAGDEATRAAIIKNDLDTIQTARDVGYVAADDAEAMRIKRTEDLAKAYIGTKDPYEQLRLLREKQGYAEFIPMDDRQAMMDHAESQIVTNQLLVERQRTAATKKAYLSALDSIDKTGSTSNIPDSLWSNLSVSQRKSAREYAESMAGGKFIATNYKRYYDLVRMAQQDPVGFSKYDLGNDRMKLGNSEFKKLADKQVSILDGENDGPDTEFDSVLSEQSAVDKSLRSITNKPQSKYNEGDMDFANAFYRIYDGEKKIWLSRNPGKKDLPPDERDKLLDELTRRSFTDPTMGSKMLAYGTLGIAGATGKVRADQPGMGGVDDETIEEIKDDLKKAGLPVNAYNIYKAYANEKAARKVN